MTIKKLAVLGSVLAGAAFLQNKERRERLLRSAQDLLNTTRERLAQASSSVASDKSAGTDDGPLFPEQAKPMSTTPTYSEYGGLGRNSH